MSFLQEFQRLREHTPRLYNIVVACENSDYCTHADKDKNCYMVGAINFSEDCMYGGIVIWCKDTVDCYYAEKCELCYECVDASDCYNCNYSQDIKNCTDCTLCYDCIGSRNCFGSSGLRQGEYFLFNEKFSREEYQKKVAQYTPKNIEKWAEALKKAEEIKKSVPHLYSHQLNDEACVGDYIYGSKNCFACFDTHSSEDCMYMADCWRTRDSIDLMFADGSELCYECFSVGLGSYNCNFCDYTRSCADSEYCDLCFSCKNCFGCVGLQGKEYHILNKPYVKDEYDKKVAEIKQTMKREGEYGKHMSSTYRLEDTAASME